ncbi:hypothetical protein [Wenxinia marina]|uniref:Integral membrane protein n=1 Tax=Wenxinia marina DSM 24838 TaxID=1123501 RepID=A0A0D0Q5Q7_9RHOB|nr:hypothetical protein [Wenxinia marina]KIQ69804.1 hypothetical protein Wenmar_01374 [Wenxinia marina DSM 24838]GGL61363.1 hypothetical protein GCM10011392_14760 [Wenxinia marina]
MRIPAAFTVFAAGAMALSALAAGRPSEALAALAVLAVAGGILWRLLRDPAATRRGGHFATVRFRPPPAGDGPRTGTFALVRTQERRGPWDVALDRRPERADLEVMGVDQGGWVWLGETGLPERVRIDYGTTWKTWPVLSAAETGDTT